MEAQLDKALVTHLVHLSATRMVDMLAFELVTGWLHDSAQRRELTPSSALA
jgi:hypothetical protein